MSRPLGVALGWHSLAFEELLALVRRAEALGFARVYVDGDVSQMPSLGDADCLEGWTTTTALAMKTERIPLASIRLVHHWNAARLAQAAATLERIAPGRLGFLVSIGGQPADRRFGLPFPRPAERIAWLDEALGAVRALWRGESVTLEGRFVHLEGARVRPVPPEGALAVEVAGRGPRLLEVVAAHADVWDVNLPPVAARVERATEALARACAARGRDPARIRRTMWVFTRPGREPGDPALARDFRALNPWFRDVRDDELPEALVAGSGPACRERLEAVRERLGIDLPVADLSGLDHDAARHALDALAGAPEALGRSPR